MDTDTLLRIHQSDDPSAAFRTVVGSLSGRLPLRGALWVGAADRSVRHRWPEDSPHLDELIDTALHVLRPEVFRLGSDFPALAERLPESEGLFLPLRDGGRLSSAVILVAAGGSFPDDPGAWEALSRSLERCESVHRRLAVAEEGRAQACRRAEESETLHMLGLAANRTLDPEEVFPLVARLARTLLGAHYVSIHLGDERECCPRVAAVGLRNPDHQPVDDPFAQRVIAARQPVSAGGDGYSLQAEDLPFHQAEGMVHGFGVPLSLFGKTFGALLMGYRRPYRTTPRDHRLALTLASHAAVAINNARLHRELSKRSADLQQTLEELQRATEAKERFFASMNHELRTPVNAISGYLTLLLDGIGGELPGKAHDYLGRAQRASGNLLTLVNDILDLSKISAGKMTVEPREVELAEVIDDVVVTVQPLAEEKGLYLTAPEGPLSVLVTDPVRLRQILLNLLSNAIKFTAEGEVALVVDPAANGKGAGEWTEIQVADTGPGIPAEDRERVFEEFEQVAGSQHKGTGLGLPLSRKIARMLGGDLTLESEEGTGSTFTLRLPSAERPMERRLVEAA